MIWGILSGIVVLLGGAFAVWRYVVNAERRKHEASTVRQELYDRAYLDKAQRDIAQKYRKIRTVTPNSWLDEHYDKLRRDKAAASKK